MDVEIHEITCCNCGVSFWVTNKHDDELRRCHNTFYCPNGHANYYKGENDREKLIKVERNLAGEKAYSNSLARSNAALRGVITKMKNKR